MMKELYRIKALPFLLWWMAFGVIIWPAGLIAIGIVFVPMALIAQALLPDSFFSSNTNGFLLSLIAVPFVGMILGLTIATLQRWLLRTKLYWAADGWRKWSMIGGAIGAYALVGVASISSYISGYYGYEGGHFAIMPAFVLCLSIFQSLALRHAVRQSWLWILGNVIGGMVFSSLLIRNYGPFILILIGLAVLSQGFITAYVMLFLFEKKLLPMSPEGREDEVSDRPRSVWDDAI